MALYDVLLAIAPSPVIRLYRAAAVAMRDGPAVRLALLDELAGEPRLRTYHPYAMARADLLQRLGRDVEAATAYREALELAGSEPEKAHLRKPWRKSAILCRVPSMGRQWLTRVLDALLRIALHRWPEPLRDHYEREWRAEIAEIRSEPGVNPVVRSIRAVRFAASLARSRVNAEGETWPDRVAATGRASRPFLLLFALPFLCFVAWRVASAMTGLYNIFVGVAVDPVGSLGLFAQSVATVLALLVAVTGMGFLGWWLGRALPVVRTGDRRLRSGAAVFAVPLTALLGTFPVLAGIRLNQESGSIDWSVPGTAGGLVAWSLGLVAVFWWARSKMLAGRRWRAVLVAAGGGGLLVWIAGAVITANAAITLGAPLATAPLWTPATLVPLWSQQLFHLYQANLPVGSAGAINFMFNAGNNLPVLVVCTVFAVAYVLRQMQAYAPPVEATRERPEPGELRLPVFSRIAYGLVAVGGLAWADVLTMPIRFMERVEAAAGDAPDTVHLWIQEIRQLAILLVGLGLSLALRRYRGAAPAAALVAAAIFVADLLIDRVNMEGWPALVFAAALATALVLAAVQLCRRAGFGSAEQANGAARFTRVAMVAGFCAPITLFNVSSAPVSAIPVDLLAGTYVVGAALFVLASCCALLARPVAMTWKPTLLAVLPVILYGCSAVTAKLSSGAWWLVFIFYGGLVIATYFFALARWSSWRGVRVVLARIGLVAAVVVGSTPALMIVFGVSTLVSPALMRIAGYAYGADGVPLATGSVIVSAGVAFLFTVTFRGLARRLRVPRTVSIAGTEPA
ncbi:hypothetical protein [Fodinicola acaciae]|uniref:hypothetical protein n=1 Tax=Fodinicola acaciae TaxID=2681555 RepID=UPI003CCDCD04